MSRAHVIAFAQVPAKSRLAGTFNSIIGPISFYVQGFAWVDPSGYQILRMRLELLTPLTQVGLLKQTTEIRMQEVHFNQVQRTLWLPSEAVVTSRYMAYLYRNRHQYLEYRLFTVDTREDQKHIIGNKPPISELEPNE